MNIDHNAVVREAVLDELRFVRAVFSAPRRGNAMPWKRVVLRPVVIKGTQQVQFTYYDEAKSLDKNRTGSALQEEVASVLGMPFRNILLELVDEHMQILVGRKGNARVTSTKKAEVPDRVLTHDRRKQLPLPAGVRDDYLVATGVMDENGRVKADKQDKFRQVNEFLRLLDQTVARREEQFHPKYVVDLGCGNAYLTFAAYHYFVNVLHQPVEMCGVDVREEPLVRHRARAAALGWDRLTFARATIVDFAPSAAPDVVLSLHACDTATDHAIARAIRWQSRHVLSVPCCHHELQHQLQTRERATPLGSVYRHGVLAERLGDIFTDTFRALILRIFGYRCDIVQFVSSEHTAKNLMIRGARAGRVADPRVVEEYARLKEFLGVTPFLERLLGPELEGVVGGGPLSV
jgi:SAM-dependent methyltransferase